MSDFLNPEIRRMMSRKGGRRKVKKGFAVNKELASEAGKKGMKSRWHGKDNTARASTEQKELSDKH